MLFHLERDNRHLAMITSETCRCWRDMPRTTQRYIKADVEAQRKVVDLI